MTLEAVRGATGRAPGPVRPEVPPGLLDVELVLAADGRTRVERLVQRFPQRVTTPMYLDPAAPGTAFLCVQNPSGGVFAGDRLTTRLRAAPGAGVQLSGQSATQVYAGGAAGHDYRLIVEPGAVLEHVPRTTIPHRDCDYRQQVHVELRGDGTYLGWDVLAAGRIGHGERFAFRAVDLRTSVSCDGVPVATEALRIVPARRHPAEPGVLGGWDYAATVLLVAPARARSVWVELADELATTCELRPDRVAAVSELPDGAGLVVRILAGRAPAVHGALRETWAIARRILLGRSSMPERIL
ncbi:MULTISPECIES: urease accessory protein UreD [Pseudonocardia]|uniref:Urease accessory protein UreD n=2 Tax=Pseudonocardia TaxID=1847 RepID=A0A1Y2N1D7_PSEAH|nr:MULTISPECIES: urease accessory protein UreD [Pseudonocardia]OSY40728.1 Urease accessory protein UreD [Pseudonocardia autotrophica]TDN71965.1 urease accessory protein [Pseudonocardia autotrophica]BBG02652.1 urease accessory protein UreD [Pseudonocardia autotrophica]GEC24711.1 urease accessory protein UreD [Pseudonocardia saturnea]